MQNIFFREAPDVLLQKTVVEDTRYEGLDKVDRGKVGLHVSILQKICTLCCISLGRCFFGLKTRVIIKISKTPCYPINVD